MTLNWARFGLLVCSFIVLTITIRWAQSQTDTVQLLISYPDARLGRSHPSSSLNLLTS